MINVYVFACGHGDTILLNLSRAWYLVDCNLTNNDGMRQRFFEFIRQHQIEQLDCIFQTHPDIDHFRGMEEILDYFTRDGRRVKYCAT
jgi:beta-lactamase superfamily II metal-dependent hydrolase